MTQPGDSDCSEVGYFEARVAIVLRREREVGIMWEADCELLGLSAVAETQRGAVDFLMKSINDHGIVGHGSVSIPGEVADDG